MGLDLRNNIEGKRGESIRLRIVSDGITQSSGSVTATEYLHGAESFKSHHSLRYLTNPQNVIESDV
jgi:hypothetical protein